MFPCPIWLVLFKNLTYLMRTETKCRRIIASLLANRLGLRVGDRITVVSKLDGASYTLAIEGIIETYYGQFLYMPLEDFNRMMGMTPDSYSDVFSNAELDYDPSELFGVKDLINMANAMDDLMMPLMMVVVGTMVIAGVMDAIIIYLVTSLMIEESRSSISLLKVFGYRRNIWRNSMAGSLRASPPMPALKVLGITYIWRKTDKPASSSPQITNPPKRRIRIGSVDTRICSIRHSRMLTFVRAEWPSGRSGRRHARVKPDS